MVGNVPFGDEVQPPPPTHHHTPHQRCTQHLTRSKHKRSLRSRDARQRRASQRIIPRARRRRECRSWQPHSLSPAATARLQQATAGNPHTTRCYRFREFLQRLFKLKRKVPQNNKTPNHLRTDSRPAASSRPQLQGRHDARRRQHTRAHWFKTHIGQPSTKGRTKHDVQTKPQHQLPEPSGTPLAYSKQQSYTLSSKLCAHTASAGWHSQRPT